jgi:UDP-N-acetylmuramoyl-tripeptide--D-alanyl-D-alanine ligase
MVHTRRPVPLRDVLEHAAVEVAGQLEPETTFGWIERNSREIQPGDLFIAVRGERFDGHDFVADAAQRGARAALVSRAWAAMRGGNVPLPLLLADDPVAALQQVAAGRRRAHPARIVGVTGSVGKTSTKEAIASGLGAARKTYRSPGNMNSEIGLPLSLLEVPDDAEVAVLEMGGAYAFGELALLADIARPAVGVVTNVHPVHIERMGSIEAIAQTKAELVQSLPPDGAAVLNIDNTYVREMAADARCRVIGYGRSPKSDLRATDVATRGLEGIRFCLHIDGEERLVELPWIGAHAVELALAAIGVGMALGVDVESTVKGLRESPALVRLVPLPGPNGSRLIDDTYNASAPSVLTALRLLSEIPAKRRIAVLGDMRELGPESERQHVEVGEYAAGAVDVLVTFGDLALTIAETALARSAVDGSTVTVQSFRIDQRDALTQFLRSELRSGDTALLKGSRGLEMETIVEAIRRTADIAGQDA